MPRPKPRVLVADDDVDTRNILSARLTRAGYEVLTAKDGEEALELVAVYLPDLALIDVVMPGPAGATLVSLLKEICPELEAIVITAYGSIEQAVETMRKGVFCYLAKPLDMAQLGAVLKQARAVQLARARGRVGVVVDWREGRFTFGGKYVPLQDLSHRERDVLDVLAEGKTDREIADVLGISVYTVWTHMRNILNKLGARNRMQAAMLWDRCTRFERRDDWIKT